jgi:hypothetical protein
MGLGKGVMDNGRCEQRGLEDRSAAALGEAELS